MSTTPTIPELELGRSLTTYDPLTEQPIGDFLAGEPLGAISPAQAQDNRIGGLLAAYVAHGAQTHANEYVIPTITRGLGAEQVQRNMAAAPARATMRAGVSRWIQQDARRQGMVDAFREDDPHGGVAHLSIWQDAPLWANLEREFHLAHPGLDFESSGFRRAYAKIYDYYRFATHYSMGEAGARWAENWLEDVPVVDRNLFSAILQDVTRRSEPFERSGMEAAAETYARGGLAIGESLATLVTELIPGRGEAGEEAQDFNEWKRELQGIRRGADPLDGKTWVGHGALRALEMLPRMAATVPAAFAGGPMGAGIFWWSQIAPDRYAQFRAEGFSETASRLGAGISAVPEAAIELLQLKQLLPSAARRGVGQVVHLTATQFLKRQTGRGLLLYGKEFGEEVAQEGVGLTTMAGLDYLDENTDVNWQKQLGASAEQLRDVALALPFLLVPGTSIGTAQAAMDQNRINRRLAEGMALGAAKVVAKQGAAAAPGKPVDRRVPAEAPPPTSKPELLTPQGAADFAEAQPVAATGIVDKLEKDGYVSAGAFEVVARRGEGEQWSKAERTEFGQLLRTALAEREEVPGAEVAPQPVGPPSPEAGLEGRAVPGVRVRDLVEDQEGAQAEREERAVPEAAEVVTPEGPAVAESRVTSIQNAVVDEERERRGLRARIRPERRGWDVVQDDAAELVRQDPGVRERLANELTHETRAVTDVEEALLLNSLIDVEDQYDAAANRLILARKAGNDAEIAESEKDETFLAARLLVIADLVGAVGTENARALNARKMFADKTFTIARMLSEKQAAKGSELTPEDRAAVAETQRQITETQRKLDEHIANGEEKPVESEVELRDVEEQIERIADIEDLAARESPLSAKDKQRVRAATVAVKRSIAKYERRIEERDLFPDRKPTKTPTTPELVALRARRDALKEEYRELQQLARPKKTRQEISLQALKTRLANRTVELRDKLARGDFAPAPKRMPTVLDKEGMRLKVANNEAKAEFLRELERDRRRNRTVPQKIFGLVPELLNTSRAILTSLDLSAVARQGGFLNYAHPARMLKELPEMFRALWSKRGMARASEELAQRPNAALYQRVGLSLTGIDQPLSRQEEVYMSRWAHCIPLVAASERAYITFLNRQRADTFDAMIGSLGRGGTVSDAEAKVIANFVNVATGRGNLGRFQQAAVPLATVFFAPRYVASRFQLLAGQPLYRGNVRLKKAIATEYARSLIGLGFFYSMAGLAAWTLAKMSGGEPEDHIQVGLDPRSADFGKIRMGNTRLDPLYGLSQTTVLLSRLVTGEMQNVYGETVALRGEDRPYGTSSIQDILWRFLRSKFSPGAGAFVDISAQEGFVREPVTPVTVAANLAIPLALRDVYDAMKEHGVATGTGLGLAAVFGLGLQTYEMQTDPAAHFSHVHRRLSPDDWRSSMKAAEEWVREHDETGDPGKAVRTYQAGILGPRANTLAAPPPTTRGSVQGVKDKTVAQTRQRWRDQRDAALKWFSDRGVSPAEARRAYWDYLSERYPGEKSSATRRRYQERFNAQIQRLSRLAG